MPDPNTAVDSNGYPTDVSLDSYTNTYDPWSDPANYDQNGQFIGPGAWDDSGNYMGPGDDPTKTGSFISKLLSGNKAQGLADASSVIGAFGQGQKANRMVQGNFTQNYDRNMLEAQQGRNANESDALKKLAQTKYILSGGSKFDPNITTASGRHITLPTFGMAPTPSSDAQKQGASTLQAQLLQRLAPGGSYTPQPLSNYATPGTGEKISDYGSLITGGLGAANTIMNGDPSSGMDYTKLATQMAPMAAKYIMGLGGF